MIDLQQRYAHYATRFRDYLTARNITGEMAGEMIGAHPTTVYDLRRGAQKLDDEWRVKVAAGLGVDHDVLFGEEPLPKPAPGEVFPAKRRGRKARKVLPHANENRLIPMFGLAAGATDGAHRTIADPVDEVACPPALRDVIGAYALRTSGESMVPRYFPGDTLYVNPHQQVRPGDHVIVQVMNDDNSGTETWVKRYDGEAAGVLRMWQYNPPAPVTFGRQHVIRVHRVLPVNELFGG